MYALVAIKFREATLRKRLLDTQQSPLKECVKSKEGYWSFYTYSGQPGQNMLHEYLWTYASSFANSRAPRPHQSFISCAARPLQNNRSEIADNEHLSLAEARSVMAAQHYVDNTPVMNLSRLQTEVSNGTYIF